MARAKKTNPDIERVASGQHHDPHSTLGVHRDGKSWRFRVWRPEAEKVRIHVPGRRALPLRRVHEAGLFEARASIEGDEAPRYEVEAVYANGDSFRFADPYAFLPTLGELDLHLFREGRHEDIHHRMGARPMTIDDVAGTAFAVWAPNAEAARVIGEFNSWDGRLHPMRSLGSSGVWELFIPGVGDGVRYKFELLTKHGWLLKKADPYAHRCEKPPATAGIVHEPKHVWGDEDWMAQRRAGEVMARPMSIYEVHLGSWRQGDNGEELDYRTLGDELAAYCVDMGYTHVEFLPLAEHPFGPSWGYQVSYYYSPTARFGSPDDLRYLIDRLHQAGIGVLIDWVPAHFPKDEWALARYDGTALYEHEDPRKGEHPDWGTLIFNYARNEVRNFLLGSALVWLDDFHVDGLRVDAVASMLYLDYSRKDGEWIPNRHGGRENLEAIDFLKELNTVVHERFPGVLMVAEESTAWAGVSRPTYTGGLGFGFKWNMGWMHDTLDYFAHDPIHRRYHHHQLTFGLVYAWHENFILALSHDEVVHGKGSLANKMPGDRWQQLANLRALYGWMWAHPGKKLNFMGSEFAQSREWSHARSLDWHLLEYDEHAGIQRLVRKLNGLYRDEPALWERDFDASGFAWIDANNADDNAYAFLRLSADGERMVACVANLAPVVRENFPIGLPRPGRWEELLNTDAAEYGGTNAGNFGGIEAEATPAHGQPYSARLTLPPLAVLWFSAPVVKVNE